MKTTSKSSSLPTLFLGIDVGKIDLFCHILLEAETQSFRFDNTEEGIQQLIKWLIKHGAKDRVAACLEQTGHYSIPVAKALFKSKVGLVYVINPRQIKAFAHQRLRRNKSDTADARLIAQFIKSEHSELRSWNPKSPCFERLTELSRYASSITEDNARLKTKLGAVSEPAVQRSLIRRIKSLKKELKDIEKRIAKVIENNNALKVQKELLISIPGIAFTSAHMVLAELPDIDLFSNARQLAAWTGLTPSHYASGTSGRTKTPITKVGSANLRAGLFMPAMTARTNNPLLKEFADRLRKNGKIPKEIIIAVMRKLIHQIYGILKSGEPFNPEKRGFQISSKA